MRMLIEGGGGYDESAANKAAKKAAAAALQLKKANERAAILTVLRGMPYEIQPIGKSLNDALKNLASEMKSFAQSSLVSNLEGGFKGQTATAASNYLKNLSIPGFKGPVKVR